ncbi:MAG: hypothetical protein ACQEUT_12000 [Bacillota bacterium]
MTSWYILVSLFIAGVIIEWIAAKFIKNNRNKTKVSVLVWSALAVIFLVLWLLGY